MLFNAVVSLIILSLIGIVKIPINRKGNIENEFLFKSRLFPEMLLLFFFIMVVINIVLFEQIFNYIGLLVSVLFIIGLIQSIKFIRMKMLLKFKNKYIEIK